MSFHKFKVQNGSRRSGPVPIAVATSREPSEAPKNHSQHDLPTQPQSQKVSSEKINNTPATSHSWKSRELSRTHAQTLETEAISRQSKRTLTRSRRSIACVLCKTSKTRCEQISAGQKAKCRRCERLNMQCYFEPSRRQIEALPESLGPLPEELQSSSSLHETTYPASRLKEKLPDTCSLEKEASSAFLEELPGPVRTSRPLLNIKHKQIEVHINSVLSGHVAEMVFHHYVHTFIPKCPMVVFPPGITPGHARETRPLLFLAIMSVASAGYCTVDDQKKLAAETRRQLADSIVVQGDKSLELVQALQVTLLWYRSLDSHKQMNLNLLPHIMITLAMDLGLDKIGISQAYGSHEDIWYRAEVQRAWLGCFMISSSLSLILRRPDMASWTADMDYYLDDLRHAKVSFTDEFYCDLVSTERLCHAIDQKLLLSNRNAKSMSAHDLEEGRSATIDFQTQIECLPEGELPPLQKSLIHFSRFAASLYAHEPALHIGRNIDEFAAHFTAKSLKSCNLFDNGKLDTLHLTMLREVVVASHGLLDAFLDVSSVYDKLALTPHIYAGRVIYALILLLKISEAVTASGEVTRGFIHFGELRLEEYLKQLVLVAEELISKDEGSALSRAFLVMKPLEKWFYEHRRMTTHVVDEAKGGEAAPSRCDNSQESTLDFSTGTLGYSTARATTPIPELRSPSWYFEDLINPAATSFSLIDDGGDNDCCLEDFFNVEMFR